MSLYDIDHAATQARLDAVTSGGLRVQGECARRSAEIGEQAREAAARQERAKLAMDELVKQAKEKPPEAPKPAESKPATLKLGAEELRPRPNPPPPRPPNPPPPRPPAPPRVAQPAAPAPAKSEADSPPLTRRTLMLGAPEDRERPADKREPELDKAPPDKPRPRPRRPPAETEDDLSGRTWLR